MRNDKGYRFWRVMILTEDVLYINDGKVYDTLNEALVAFFQYVREGKQCKVMEIASLVVVDSADVDGKGEPVE